MSELKYLYPGGYEALAPTTAKGITATVRNPSTGNFTSKRAKTALITVEDNPIRFTLDGTTPTASVGHLMSAGQSYVVENEYGVQKFQCIDVSAASSVKVTVFFESIG